MSVEDMELLAPDVVVAEAQAAADASVTASDSLSNDEVWGMCTVAKEVVMAN
jgi:hypothetical protein